MIDFLIILLGTTRLGYTMGTESDHIILATIMARD